MKHRTREGADKQVVIRFSEKGYTLLKEVSHEWGQTYSGLFEMLIRLEAERLGILVKGQIIPRPQPVPSRQSLVSSLRPDDIEDEPITPDYRGPVEDRFSRAALTPPT